MKGLIHLCAFGSDFSKASLSSELSNKLPPSVGWFPFQISGTLHIGLLTFCNTKSGASTKYGLILLALIA